MFSSLQLLFLQNPFSFFLFFYKKDTSNIKSEINPFQAQGNVLICGDLNARTCEEPDFTNTPGNNYIFVNNHLYLPFHSHRNNYDKKTNAHGEQLLKLHRSLGQYIVNGRFRGDSGKIHLLFTSAARLIIGVQIQTHPLSEHLRSSHKLLCQITAKLLCNSKGQIDSSVNHIPSLILQMAPKQHKKYQKTISNKFTFLLNPYPHRKERVNLDVKDLNI